MIVCKSWSFVGNSGRQDPSQQLRHTAEVDVKLEATSISHCEEWMLDVRCNLAGRASSLPVVESWLASRETELFASHYKYGLGNIHNVTLQHSLEVE